MRWRPLGWACLSLAACERSASPPAKPPAPQGIWFADATKEAGLSDFVQENGNRAKPFIIESIGGGVAFLDFDNDGWLDVYLSNGSSLEGFAPEKAPRDALYRNDGHGKFVDVTAKAKLGDASWTFGAAAADADNDGWTDLYLTGFGGNTFLHNEHDGTFRDATREAGIEAGGFSTGACFADLDRDGDLDLYVANYVSFDRAQIERELQSNEYRGERVYFGPRGMRGEKDRLFRNESGGKFVDETKESKIADPGVYGFEAVAFDYDDDGRLDVFVANDSKPNFLWKNLGDGTFKNAAMEAGVAFNGAGTEQAGMGVALGDYNGDGRIDLFLTTFSEDYSTLFRNDGGGFFTDVSRESQLAKATMMSLGWGSAFADFDLDGDVDLFQANGHVYPQVDKFEFGTRYRQANQVFENRGDGRFDDVSARSGPALALRACGRGAAFGDFDNDGDVDVLVNNLDDRPTLLRNDSPRKGHWLMVKLVGARSPRDGSGARVVVEAGGKRFLRLAGPGGSFLSASDPRVHFGLGAATRADAIEVRWPSGLVERLPGAAADQLITIREGEGIENVANLEARR